MAGEATIGALRVVLGADTAKFEDNLKSALGSFEQFGKRLADIAGAVGIGLGLEKIASTLIESFNQAVESADKLSKASQKFGVPVEELSQLSNAAALSDVSLEQLGSSLSRLSKNMVAAQGPTSEQATAFKALGISVTDSNGQLKSADQILLQVADSFSKFRDGTTKTALAVAIFGRAGADLIPMLNQGAAGIKDTSARLGELGTVTASTAEQSERFRDNLQLLEKAKTNLILKIVGESGLLPALVQLTDSMIGGSQAATQLADVFSSKLGAAIVEIEKFFEDLKSFVDNPMGSLLSKSINIADAINNIGVQSAKAAGAGMDKLVGSVDEFANAQKKLATAPPAFDPEFAKKLHAFNDELNKLSMQTLTAAGIFDTQLAPGFLAAAGNMEVLKGQIKFTADGLVTLGPLAEKFNQAMLQLQGTQIIESTLPAWQQFQDQVTRNTTALQALGLTSEQIAEINARAAQKAGVSWQNATGEILTNAASGFAAFAQKNKEFAGIAKGLAIAEATWNTYQAATKALATYPPPFGEIAAAAAVVAGLGMVAKITAQSFAMGGSFRVPGGFSGVDSQMIPLALAPGERVDVTPASQVRDRSRGATEIILRGLGPRDLFTGSNLRDLIDALNQGARDGYRLKFAER